ncbi:MAG: arsenate reductase ArsC [archaeon]
MKILFICLGNIARSQIAEGFYNHLTKTDDAKSAGANDTYLYYKHPLPYAIEVMKEEDIDISKQYPKQVTEDMIKAADNIYVLCKKEYCPVFVQESKKASFWNIPDPYQSNIKTFREIRDKIKEKVSQII